MRAPAPICKDAAAFVKAHLGKDCFAPFTGQDYAAFGAWVHLLHLLCVCDEQGRRTTLLALSHLLHASQVSVWPVFKKAIPHALDWSDEDRLWQEITA